MNVAEKVAKFKQDLKNDNKKLFNVWAFVFGSFYFFCTGISVWYFFLFFVFPWIFTATLVAVLPNVLLWATTGFLISHIWAGFVANPEKRRYKEEYIKRFKGLKPDANVKYFNISLLRLWLSSFFTFGLYDIYWSYRNWAAYKKATKDDVEPLLLALFNFITVFCLQSKISRLLPEKKRLNAVCAAMYSLVFIGVVVAYANSVSFIGLLLLTAYVVLPMLLFPIQKSIIELAGKTTKEHATGEIVVLAVGIYWFLQSFFATAPIEVRLSKFSEVQQQNIGETVGFIYRHEKAYAEVCAAEGYQLSRYPNDFAKYFQTEIAGFEKFLGSRGIGLDEVADVAIEGPLKTKILMSVYDELRMLRRVVLANVAATVQNIPPEKVVVKEEWENALPLAEVCNLFDIGGIDLLKNSSVRDFFKLKKF